LQQIIHSVTLVERERERYVLDSEVVARLNHPAKLVARSTATVVETVADYLVPLPPRVRRFGHDAMLHRRRQLITAHAQRCRCLNSRLLRSARPIQISSEK